MQGTSEKGDAFGSALHLGDADGDGPADLAVGGPEENAGSEVIDYAAAQPLHLSPGAVPSGLGGHVWWCAV
ncbi:FG-GAP repeat protein [Streptomyces sp. NPDC087903]|uniref:FG-GAP repeat protein n=1 Tax=Streptomyces sp. NPDC087903 TaxID=3365819 RepID=UPI00382576E4